jgi:hypothetical protein
MGEEDAKQALHPLWRRAACLDGRCFYLNPFCGALSRAAFPAPLPVRGGILADEMVRPRLFWHLPESKPQVSCSTLAMHHAGALERMCIRVKKCQS